jgi:hypothetical protein
MGVAGGIASRKNVGILNACVDERLVHLKAVSGERDYAGFVNPGSTFGLTPSSDYALDSEVKLLAELLKRTAPSAAGMAYLYSERFPCSSCRKVVEQFRMLRPGIQLQVTAGFIGEAPS